jgi:hypothetical protein
LPSEPPSPSWICVPRVAPGKGWGLHTSGSSGPALSLQDCFLALQMRDCVRSSTIARDLGQGTSPLRVLSMRWDNGGWSTFRGSVTQHPGFGTMQACGCCPIEFVTNSSFDSQKWPSLDYEAWPLCSKESHKVTSQKVRIMLIAKKCVHEVVMHFPTVQVCF